MLAQVEKSTRIEAYRFRRHRSEGAAFVRSASSNLIPLFPQPSAEQRPISVGTKPQSQISDEQSTWMRQIGVDYYKKTKTIYVPTPDRQHLRQILDEEFIEDVLEFSSWIAEYVEGEIVVDGWGTNNEGRGKWVQQMLQEDPVLFRAFCYDRDKLRPNNMTHVSGALYNISADIELSGRDPSLAAEFYEDAKVLRQEVTGYGAKPFAQRLATVDRCDAIGLRGLERLYGTSNTQEMLVVDAAVFARAA